MATPLYAVLTGDLIGSTRVPAAAQEGSMACLAAMAGRLVGWPEGVPPRFTRHRGDGWQIVAPATFGLRVALVLAAALRARPDLPATRLAIGLGAATSLGSADLRDARGPAFEASGHALDTMERQRLLALSGTGVTPLHQAVLRLMDLQLARWTAAQAEIAAEALHPEAPTLADLAARHGITPQAVSERMKAGGITALRRALEDCETSHRQDADP